VVRSYSALTTLLRNRINKDAAGEFEWLHDKGITLKIEDGNLYSMQTEKEGHKSELTEVCYNGLIYRGPELVCYKGPRIPATTLTEAREQDTIVWNDKTVFAEKVVGKKMFMYWDSEKDDWAFADENKPVNNSYGKILRDKLYNINNIEYFYTYVFVISEDNDKHNTGVYLECMYDNKTGKEVDWNTVWNYAQRLKAKPVQYYFFEGFDKLEPEDFPIQVLDISKNRILLTGI
jgi:hypothetical protein